MTEPTERIRRTKIQLTEDERRLRHAAAQRRHISNLRAKRAPTREDIALAMLEAVRRQVIERRIVNIGVGATTTTASILTDTIGILVERGFHEKRSRRRLKSTLVPRPVSASEAEDEDDGPLPGLEEGAPFISR